MDNLMLVAGRAGQTMEITLRSHPLANYESYLVWEMRDSKLRKQASGRFPHNESGTVRFTPGRNGIYLLGASAGSCPFSVVGSNVALGLYGGEKLRLRLIYGAERLYFRVPPALEEFSLSMSGSRSETVRVNVFNPGGTPVATGQTTLQAGTATVRVPVAAWAGDVWSLQVTRADEGVLEDNEIRFGPGLPPILALSPDHVFGLSAPE
jgi:hypothetical protein